jgi:YhcH/YjgK/YiaL family protein
MILDSLINAENYAALGPRFRSAVKFLCSVDAGALEPPTGETLRHAIEGDDVFALVQRSDAKSPEEAFWEAHRRHIDVQCVFEGVERMGWAHVDSMRVKQPYDLERDFVMLEPKEADCQFITVRAGMFAVFFPTDAHMPSLSVDGQPREVKKIVVKIRCT